MLHLADNLQPQTSHIPALAPASLPAVPQQAVAPQAAGGDLTELIQLRQRLQGLFENPANFQQIVETLAASSPPPAEGELPPIGTV